MLSKGDAEEADLRAYLRVLRRRKWIIMAATLVVIGSALGWVLVQPSLYRSTAQLLLQPRREEASIDPVTGNPVLTNVVVEADRLIQNEIENLKSEPVKEAVRQKLGSAPPVSVKMGEKTDVVWITAESRDRQRAAVIANAYADAYVEVRRKQTVDDISAVSEALTPKIDDIKRRVAALDARVAQAPPPARGAAQAGVAPEREGLVTQQAMYQKTVDQLQLTAALKGGGARLLKPATPSDNRFHPAPVRSLLLAGWVGLALGVALAFLREFLDDTIKGQEEAQGLLPDLPMLGAIPAVATRKNQRAPAVISLSEPTSPVAESYRGLRTALEFVGLDQPTRTLQVTSTTTREGKTTTVANLGVALARAGHRVIALSCDLRRPRLHEHFGLSNKNGFTSVLLGQLPLSGALQSVPGQDGLSVLAAGPSPPNPSELLAGERTVEVLSVLQNMADIVLVDSPPVLPVSDAVVLSGRVDSVLVVVAVGKTTRRELRRAIERLRQVEAPLVGMVLNGVSAQPDYGYEYYAYGYSGGDAAAPRQAAPTGF